MLKMLRDIKTRTHTHTTQVCTLIHSMCNYGRMRDTHTERESKRERTNKELILVVMTIHSMIYS